jgi:hypothetical protein
MTIISQPHQPPIRWNGYYSALGFQFWADEHLCHLTRFATTDYNVYRAAERPHWELATVYGSEYVDPGEFLIFREVDMTDRECPGLPALVCAVHAGIMAATPNRVLPRVPSRYISAGHLITT